MNRVLTSVKKNFVLYFLWALFAILFIAWGFSMLTKVPEEKKIDIFIHAREVDENYLNEFINDNKDDYLMEINYRIDDSSETLLNQQMMTYGTVEADMFIIEKNVLEASNFDNYFLELNKEEWRVLFGNDISFYTNNQGKAYGIEIDVDFINDEDQIFYVLFSNKSLHLGSLTNSEYNGAINLCKALLERSKNKE